jgi:DNA-binding NarL/FixJ family response regulator
MKQTIKILVAEDHPLYRDGLRQTLGTDPALQLLHEAATGPEALHQARLRRPDIAILDINLPGLSGLDIARARLEEGLSFEIIFLTMYKEDVLFHEAVNLGAKGYVLKESATAEILEAIHAVAEGRHYISPSLSGLLVKNANVSSGATSRLAGLTPTQRRILKLIASDRTSKEIASDLGLSQRTVENHRANISARLGLQGSHSLLKFAFENKASL